MTETQDTCRLFFEQFVVPAYAEWLEDMLSIRKSVVALCEFDNLAERAALATGAKSRPEVREARRVLSDQHPQLSLIRDIHDTHKHGPLDNKYAVIRSGQRPVIKFTAGAFQEDAFANKGFQTGTVEVIIETDTGETHDVWELIDWAYEFWALRHPRHDGSVLYPYLAEES